MGYRDNRGPAPFLAINPRDVSLGRELRSEDAGTATLSSLNDPSGNFYQSLLAALDGVSSGMGLAGLPSITMDNAGSNSALYLAMALTCGTIAGLPLQVFEEKSDGTKSKIATPDTRYLWRHPNAEETPQEFWETVYAHHSLAGDMFIYCHRNGLGEVVELDWIHPYRMEVGRDPISRRKVYVLDGDRERPMVTAGLREGEIIHVRNLTWARKGGGLRGFGLIDLARAELQLDKSMLQHALTFMAKGGVPAGIITSDADISNDDAAKLVARWMKANGGLANTGKPAVLGNGGKYQAVGTAPQSAGSNETRVAQLKMIARFTGVPTHMLMDSTGSTTWGTGLENLGQGFVTFTLSRKSRPVEQALQRILPDSRYVRWNYGALVRGNLLQRMQSYQIKRVIGMASNDELRELEDEAPIKIEDLWKYQQPLNSNLAAPPPPGAEGDAGGDMQAQIDALKDELAALKG